MKSRVPVLGHIVLPSPQGAHLPFVGDIDHSCSSRTFGSAHSTPGSCGSFSASLVFKKASGHLRKQLSLVPVDPTQLHCNADASADVNGCDSLSLPISANAHPNLGLLVMLQVGGPHGSRITRDPDSDIPDKLQVILSSSDQEIDDTLTFDPNMMYIVAFSWPPARDAASFSKNGSIACARSLLFSTLQHNQFPHHDAVHLENAEGAYF